MACGQFSQKGYSFSRRSTNSNLSRWNDKESNLKNIKKNLIINILSFCVVVKNKYNLIWILELK